MNYRQITPEERYMLSALRKQGFNQSQIAAALGRHRSSICRELQRNSSQSAGHYRPRKAQERTNGRRPTLTPQSALHRQRRAPKLIS